MGISVAPEEILTSGMATASYLSERYPAKEMRIFVLGEAGASQAETSTLAITPQKPAR
jgi:4-nitrophenyl phosphatase